MSDEEREYLNEMIRSLNNQLVDALRERDDARRMYCEAVNRHHVRLDAFGIAKNHGWNCYEKDNEKS